MNDKLNAILNYGEDDSRFTNEKFQELWFNAVLDRKKDAETFTESQRTAHFEKQFSLINYEQAIAICPEPITFMKEISSIDDQQEFIDAFFHKSKEFKYVYPNNTEHNRPYWYNETKEGINLRPGKKRDGEKAHLYPITLGNDSVHGLIAGVTGSGKSVLLNNLIANLLMEYPSWELDLYLLDFKKVEFAPYLNNNKALTPHVKAVGVTDEIPYVISLLVFLRDSMEQREKLFSRLNVQNIRDFRNKYQMTLPRILLIADEFQQMFLNSSGTQSQTIERILTAITKKGRALGVHLLFASQDMGNTLPGSVLSNFRARFALKMPPELSETFIGTNEAERIDIGQAIVSTGDRNNLIYYDVPFIEGFSENGDDESKTPWLQTIQERSCELNKQYQFEKIHKFYQEEFTKSIDTIKNIKSNLVIKTNTIEMMNNHNEYLEFLILGPSVTYSEKRNDFETLFIERGKAKGILLLADTISDLSYLMNLVAENIKNSVDEYSHEVCIRNNLIENVFELTQEYFESEDNMPIALYKNRTDSQIEQTINHFYREKEIYDIINSTVSAVDFLEQILVTYIERTLREVPEFDDISDDFEKYKNQIIEGFEKADINEFGYIDVNDIPIKVDDEEFYGIMETFNLDLNYFLDFHYKYHQQKITNYLPKKVYWFIGMENSEIQNRTIMDFIQQAGQYNILSIFATNTEVDYSAKESFNYIFISSQKEKWYNMFGLEYSEKSIESLKIDVMSSHINKQQSFKKFNVEYKEVTQPTIDLDQVNVDF